MSRISAVLPTLASHNVTKGLFDIVAALIGLLGVIVLPWLTASASIQTGTVNRQKRSDVHLVDVSRVPPIGLKDADPAEDGLRLVFLVVSRVPGKVTATVRELRDLTIGSDSYRSMTSAKLGVAIEPMTEVLEPSTLIRIDKSLARLLPKASIASVGMVVDIFGAKMPHSGPVRMLLQVGWDGHLEEFPFEVELSNVPAETKFSQYRPTR